MTVAASFEQSGHYPLGVRSGGSHVRRIAIVFGLMTADLACFAVADALLHLLAQPPALALFRNRTLGQPNTVVDLVMIIALVFVAARYLIGDYSKRQLFWDGARATTTALLISGGAYVAAVSLLEPKGVVASLAVWIGMLFVLPTARQLMRLFLGKIGMWHLPTAIIGTSPMAQEVVPVLGKQLALGLKVHWVVPESPEKHLSSAFSGLVPVMVPQEELVPAAVRSSWCRTIAPTPIPMT